MKKTLSRFENMVSYVILSSFSLVAVLPFMWGVVSSLKERRQLFLIPARFLPESLFMGNYTRLLSGGFLNSVINSTIVSLGAVIIVAVLGVMSAYSLARFRFRGSSIVLGLIIGCMMVPGLANLVPTYMVMSTLGMIDTYTGLLIAYVVLNLPMAIWIMRGFFQTLPSELEQAAMVDGCSRFQCMYKIMIPIAKPGLSAMALFTFLNSWNDHLVALTITTTEALLTVPVRIYYTLGDQGTDWGMLTAGATLSVIPTIILFIILQKNFISGLSAGAVKG